jgi:hypothetical protein
MPEHLVSEMSRNLAFPHDKLIAVTPGENGPAPLFDSGRNTGEESRHTENGRRVPPLA